MLKNAFLMSCLLLFLPMISQVKAQNDARDLSGTISARYKVGGQSFSYASKKAAKTPNTLYVSLRKPNEAFGRTEFMQTVLRYTDVTDAGMVIMQMFLAEPDGAFKWKIVPDNYLKATFNRNNGHTTYELVGERMIGMDTEGKGNRVDKQETTLGYKEMFKSTIKHYIRTFKQNFPTELPDPYTFSATSAETGSDYAIKSQRRVHNNKQCELILQKVQGGTITSEYQTVYEPKVDLAEPHLLKIKVLFSQANGFFWLIDKNEYLDVTFDYMKGKMSTKIVGVNLSKSADNSLLQEQVFDASKTDFNAAAKMAVLRYAQIFKKLMNNPAPNSDKLLGEFHYKNVDYQYEIMPGLGRAGQYSILFRTMELNEDEEYEIKQVFQTNLFLTEDATKMSIRINYAEANGYAWKIFASDAFIINCNKGNYKVDYSLSGTKIMSKIPKLEEEKMRKLLRSGEYTTVDWLRLVAEQLIVQCQPLFREPDTD